MKRSEFMMGGKKMSDLKAGVAMENRVKYCHSTAKWKDVASILLDRGYGSLPVCDDDVNLIGIVSEDDLLETLLAKQEVKNIEAGDVMTKAPMTVTEDTQILDVIKLLDEHKLMRIPVVDGTRLVGILTRRDVLFCYLKATSASTKLW